MVAASNNRSFAMKIGNGTNRRDFLKSTFLGTIAALAAPPLATDAQAQPAAVATAKAPDARVALTARNDRADNIFRSLRMFEKDIAQAIGSRRVVIKPNNVSTDVQLCATHADCLEG